MNSQISKALRSVQVYFPSLQDYRFQFQRTVRRLINKTHEADFEVLSFLPRSGNNLFLDVGANRGDAIQSILMRRPDANVIAFEPNSLLVEKINKLYRNDSRVKIYNCGLGSENNFFELYIPFYNNYMFDGLASFKEKNARNWLETRLYGFKEEKLAIKKIMCSVRCLDDFSLRPFFIKIDVQGFEYEVLLRAKKTIEDARPILLIETPNETEGSFLNKLHYQPFFYSGKLVTGKGRFNTFFIPDEFIPMLKGTVTEIA